ncbi:MAG: hypothetical protein ACLSA6_07615 [Holdemania massiliensis]
MPKTLILDIDNTLIEAMKELRPAAKQRYAAGWPGGTGWYLPAAKMPVLWMI